MGNLLALAHCVFALAPWLSRDHTTWRTTLATLTDRFATCLGVLAGDLPVVQCLTSSLVPTATVWAVELTPNRISSTNAKENASSAIGASGNLQTITSANIPSGLLKN